jgi:phenylalanyl-tRNA synthetase beta chain
MKIVLSWLREMVPVTSSVEELTALFNSLGLEVEGVERVGQGLDGIVTAQVRTIRPHPNADKIRLVDIVTDPNQTEPLQVCCGAWNFAEGDIVPFATLGTTMPDGMKIEKRKLRGEWSNGMLCSTRELGAGDDHGGILQLPEGTVLGQAIADTLGIVPDVVFDLSVNPNRPDAMSVLGVARDVAAKLGLAFTPPQMIDGVVTAPPSSAPRGSITATDLCDRLTVTVVRNVVVTDSPKWIQSRLLLSGMRPISNLVDASNLVMLELGAPTHAFDLDKLGGHRIGVRWAKTNETLTTLDSVVRTVGVAPAQDGVITDGNDVAVGIAAVMGGLTSEVSESTQNLLIEAAHWTPMCIARTAKRLGLRSEASARFERGTDPEALPSVVARLVEIIRLTCPDAIVESFDDFRPVPTEPKKVRVRTSRVNLILGTELSDATIKSLLDPIGFTATALGTGEHDVVIPSWRPDSTAEIDVIEEVGRHHGYDNIVRQQLRTDLVGGLTPLQRDRRRVADFLAASACSEVWTPTFLSPADLVAAKVDGQPVLVANPMSPDESVMRPSLLPGLLKVLAHNANHRNPAARLFEIGHTFAQPRPDQILPYERDFLGVVFAHDGDDARSAVALLDQLVVWLRINPSAIGLKTAEISGLHPTRSARVINTGTGFSFGVVGEIDPSVCEGMGIDRRVGYLALDLENLLGQPRRGGDVLSFSRFPSSDIDLAFVVADTVSADAVAEAISRNAGELCQSVALFDVYRGKGMVEGSRSLAYRLRFGANDRTLTDTELGTVREQIITGVHAATNATLRA